MFSMILSALMASAPLGAEIAIDLNFTEKALKNVQLADAAKMNVEGREYALTTVGTALAKRVILGISLNVYVGQLFLSEPEKYVREIDRALDSTSGVSAGFMRLTMLRNLDGSTVDSAFQEALEMNGIDTDTPEMNRFSEAVAGAGALKKGESIFLVCEQFADRDIVTFVDSKNQVTHIPGAKGFSRAVYAMFIGAGGTKEREGLRRQLIKGEPDND